MPRRVAYTRSHMSKTSKSKDKRSRMDLELFVLALICRGVATPYDLKVSAAISPGASIPVLGRLETAGLIRKGKEGARNRQEYLITGTGTILLENSWRQLFQGPPADFDAILRIASLALLMGEPKRSVAAYLSRASTLRKTANADSPYRSDDSTTPGAVFMSMRRVAASGRAQSEAAVLRRLASVVRRPK
jgi:DNA-binding PadR family transcriptional regulator